MSRQIRETSRRQFIHFLSASPLFGLAGPLTALPQQAMETAADESLAKAKNVFEVQKLCATKLTNIAQRYCDGGADDLKTTQENSSAFDRLQIRARRLVDVSKIDTRVKIFGQQLASPIMLCPVGFLQVFHKDGELAVAAACNKKRHQMIVSTVSTFSIKKIAAKSSTPPWFQLYPTPKRKITEQLIRQAQAAKCKIMALTIDTPVIGNRENHAGFLTRKMANGELIAGNFVEMGEKIEQLPDPSLDWDFVKWLKDQWKGPVILKGVVTHEDAKLCLKNKVDGIIVSNHGGRQLESLRSTIECLPEIIDVIGRRIPVLIDGGFRRGTDIFKALALGASAVAIGRPYLWGLAAGGQSGVERVLELLQAELIRDMQLAGTPDIKSITKAFVAKRKKN